MGTKCGRAAWRLQIMGASDTGLLRDPAVRTTATATPAVSVDHDQYANIASFRYQLRRFFAFSELAAAREGLPQQQYQALIAVAGHQGEEPPVVGTIAEQLLIAPHSAAELVHRMVEAGLLIKSRSPNDARKVVLELTVRARAVLNRLTDVHRAELEAIEPFLCEVLKHATVREHAGIPQKADEVTANR